MPMRLYLPASCLLRTGSLAAQNTLCLCLSFLPAALHRFACFVKACRQYLALLSLYAFF